MRRIRMEGLTEAFFLTVVGFMFYQVIFGLSNLYGNVLFCIWMIFVDALVIIKPESTAFKERYRKIIYACIIVFANLLWAVLASGPNFHYDEAYTIGMIRRSWSSIVSVTSQDVHSPLYYFALKTFFLISGGKYLWLTKVFSMILMDAYLIFGGRSIRKLYDGEVALYWTILSCFMPPMMIHATNVRMYAMAIFFVTIGCLHAIQWYREHRIKDWILFTIMFCLAVYSHTFVLLESFLIYVVMLAFVVVQKNKEKILLVFGSGLIVVVSYLPWLSVLYKQFLIRSEAGAEEGISYLEKGSEEVMKYLGEWFSAIENPSVLQILFGVFLLLFLSYHVRDYVKKTGDKLPILGIVIAAITVLMAVWVSIAKVPCFLGRYVMPLFGSIWLFMAVGMREVKERWKVLIIICTIIVSGLATFRTEKALENPDGLMKYNHFLEQYDAENEVVMYDNYHLAMLSIFNPDKRCFVYGYAPPYQAFEEVDAFYEWEQLDGVDIVYYVNFYGGRNGNLDENYRIVDTMRFQYSYYDIEINRYVRKNGSEEN